MRTTKRISELSVGDTFTLFGHEWTRRGAMAAQLSCYWCTTDASPFFHALYGEQQVEYDEPQQMPKYWPPRNGDLWESPLGTSYYVDRGKWYSGRTCDHYTINGPGGTIDGRGWALVYREGVKP